VAAEAGSEGGPVGFSYYKKQRQPLPAVAMTRVVGFTGWCCFPGAPVCGSPCIFHCTVFVLVRSVLSVLLRVAFSGPEAYR
jgi:hypothetical protein